MGIVVPAPEVLGVIPLTLAVELVCLAHLIACLVFVSTASSKDPYMLAGVTIFPLLQCANAAWFLLGIPLIIVAGVGAVYRIESHLKYYFYYLIACLLVAAGWLTIFVRFGTACTTTHHASGSSTFSCGVTDGFLLVGMFLLLVIIVGAVYLVWSMREYLKQRMEAELMSSLEPWQRLMQHTQDCAAEDQRRAKEFYHKKNAKMNDEWGWAPGPEAFQEPC
eukprot:gnl/TRDRNA2_/TRDRNA2_189030_c0_seq1.p1 gnl/TRDRNA2_/TRDRNA2_189030_c0~~gnl/TRDRNA2_/TRDRNA2_189030_c0_seq1.p1  ORF type:complete len:221 (+),score=29.36 gnl/TRDRNA2_/TRDRNA2_189030_c0_seq1:88-750(+)